jgi:predicted ATPase/DNA-binding XRE family transcriptional regulator
MKAEMESPVTFSQWLRQRRSALKLTREQLAQRVGCSVSALRKIEDGERRPSRQIAELLANALDLPPADRPAFFKVARGELSLNRLPSPQLHSGGEAVAVSVPPRVNVPILPTPLIGRQRALAELDRLLCDPQCRLLTLVGPGGIGKTHLAIEAASQFREAFTAGVYFVSLTPLNSSDFIVPAIADAISFAFSGPADPQAQLFNYLREKQLLLVLDNFEHLLARQGAEVIADLLQHAPDVKLLITSCETLNLQGEWVFEVEGLPIPEDPVADEAQGAGAVELFVQRARRANVRFNATPQDYPAIIRICRLVAGMPLGIELAAAWVRTLSCGEIVQELERGLDFLAVSARDLPARHRSMRAVFEHSWELLTDEEQRVLCGLAAFQGGFRREAAEQVAGGSLSLLSALVAKSLLRRAVAGRYDLHEVIRQYALSYLANDPRYPETYDRHCDYYLGLVRDRENALKSAAQQEAVRELMSEMDNVRAAWAWAITRGKFTAIGQAVRSLGWFFEVTGLPREGIEQFGVLVQALKANAHNQTWPEVIGLAQAQQGLLFFRRGQFGHAQSVLEESLASLRPLSEPALLTDALVYLGIIMYLNGDLDRAQSLMEEGLACAQARGDQWLAAYARYNQGYLAGLAGHYIEGYEQMLAGLATWRSLGDPHSISLGLNFLVPTLIKLGHYEEAKTFMQESLELCALTGNRWGMGTAYRFWGVTNMAQGDFSEALALLHKSLEVFQGFTTGWDIARTLSYLGETTLLMGNLPEAREIYMEALHLSIEAKAIPVALDVLVGLAQLYARTDESEQALELSYHVWNHPASTQEARDRAHQLLEELEAHLTPLQIEAAQARAQAGRFEAIPGEPLES